MPEIKDCRIQVQVMAGEYIEMVVEDGGTGPKIRLTPSSCKAIAEALVQAAAMVEAAKSGSKDDVPAGASRCAKKARKIAALRRADRHQPSLPGPDATISARRPH